jgi:hypothetical protein
MFSCTKAAGDVPTTDCNVRLGVETGACCYNAVGTTSPTKAATAFAATTNAVVTALAGVWPINKDDSKFFCTTEAFLSGSPGYSSVNGTMSIDASARFTNGATLKADFAGSTSTWTCSGASALAASGAAAAILISLL